MDAVLEQTIKLACAVRDSEEALAWRRSWDAFRDVKFTTPNLMDLPLNRIPLPEYLGHLRMAEQASARPVMFPVLVSSPPSLFTAAQIRSGLKNWPDLEAAYEKLAKCLGFACTTIAFLRKAGPGYPHKGLVFTLPNTPWMTLSSRRELPWNLGDDLVPEGASDATALGLHRFAPSVSQQLATKLNALLAAIRDSATWQRLRVSYEAVQRHRNVTLEMDRARSQFQKEFGRWRKSNIPRPLLHDRAEELAQDIYSRRGPRIQAYIDSYWEYERLIERIYWLTSQIVVNEIISCITSAGSQQLQQVSLSCGPDAYLTAVAPTLAKTLEVGQLVYCSLAELEHRLDGLYQVEQWIQEYHVATGVRLLFRARCLWYSDLTDLQSVTEASSTFVPSEAADMLGGARVEIHGPDNEVVASLVVKDRLVSLELPKTMYLP